MFKVRCLYSLMRDGRWDGSGYDLVLTKQWNYARNHIFCLLFNKHIWESYYTGQKIQYIWVVSLIFSQMTQVQRQLLYKKSCWCCHQVTTGAEKHPSHSRQVPQGFLLELASFQRFQKGLMWKQSCRTEHTLLTKESKKWYRQWPTSKGGKTSTTLTNLYFLCKQSTELM